MVLGINNGAFFQVGNKLSENIYHVIKDNQVNAFEFCCNSKQELNELFIDKFWPSILEWKLDWISLHSPCIEYRNNSESKEILMKIANINKRYKIKNIVFHTDKFADWPLIKSYNLPISIENMDSEASAGRTVSEIENIVNKFNFNLTLDIQHCYVNDASMKLAQNFYRKFRDKIIEFHVSGFGQAPHYKHYPLYKSKQNEIIDFVKDISAPLIIESVFDSIEEVNQELLYVRSKLK